MLTPTFWADKRVLVTGQTGFVGSWLSMTLLELGANVFGYALEPNTDPNLFSLLELEDRLTGHCFGDIRDLDSLSSFCEQSAPEIIIHLAAQPLVGYAYYHPVETFETNAMGTVHLLECFKESTTARILLNVTTDKCYENREWEWAYRENDALGGKEPYSSSKACSELITAAYRHSYLSLQNKGIATARAGNIIGGGDWSKDRLIPDFMRALISKKPLDIRYPGATRPWQYVLEPVFGYLKLCEKLWEEPDQHSEGWNFGPREEDVQTVESIIRTLCEYYPVEINWSSNKQFYESKLLKLDVSKAKKYLSWSPTIPLEEALERTMNWYLAYVNQEDMFEYTQQEILAHLQTLEPIMSLEI